MDINKICPGCMKEIENRNSLETCPLCGYDFRNHRAEPHQLQPFTILAGKYLVGKVIGEGGFGISYLGIDINLDLPVAIKEYYPNGFVTRESNHTTYVSLYSGKSQNDVAKWRDGFLNEAKNLAKFSNLNGIVEVRDYFTENNTAYIVMEYIDGITLKQYLKQNGGKIPVDQTFEMMKPVIKSLSKVHDSGMIHRDISPDNIMITKYGGMKLLDFGAAREFAGNAEKSLSIMLKPGYAPEEQYRTHGQQGPWSDVYAVTATIYKCITGVTPPESMERMRADTLKSPRELGVGISDNQEAALRQGMAVYAEHRLQNMDALYHILYSDHQVSIAPPPMPSLGQPFSGGPAGPFTQTQADPVSQGFTHTQTGPVGQPFSPPPSSLFSAGNEMAAQGSAFTAAQKKTLLIGAAALLGVVVVIVCLIGVSTSSNSGSPEASRMPEAPAAEAPAAEVPEGDLVDISDQVAEIHASSSGEDALNRVLTLLEEADFAHTDSLSATIGEMFDSYEQGLIQSTESLLNQPASVPMCIQMKVYHDSAMSYANRFNEHGFNLEYNDIENYYQSTLDSYRSILVGRFDELAQTDLNNNGAVPGGSIFWDSDGGMLMSLLPESDLYQPDHREDPLMLRYAAAQALWVEEKLRLASSDLGNSSGEQITKIRGLLAEADYQPYVVYCLVKLGDQNARKFFDRNSDFQAVYNHVAAIDLDEMGRQNYIYSYFADYDMNYSSMRQTFRQYGKEFFK